MFNNNYNIKIIIIKFIIIIIIIMLMIIVIILCTYNNYASVMLPDQAKDGRRVRKEVTFRGAPNLNIISK